MSASIRKARPTGAFIPQDLLLDSRLGPSEKILYAIIPETLRIEEGAYYGTSTLLAGMTGISVRSVARALERLARHGYLDFTAREGYKGGFLIRFRKASAVAMMLAVMSFVGAGASLHMQDYGKNAQGSDMRGNPARAGSGYGLYDRKRTRRKSERKKPLPKDHSIPETSILKDYDKNRSQHGLQLA